MPLDKAVKALLGRARFWTEYYFLTETPIKDGDGPVEMVLHRVDFTFSRRYKLNLTFDNALSQTELFLIDARVDEPILLGTAEMAHPNQWCLRWQEAVAVCRWLSRRNKSFPYPGRALLLLFPFVALTAADDVARVGSILTRAWRSLELFSKNQIERLVRRTLRPQQHWQWSWSNDHGGWVLDDLVPGPFGKSFPGMRNPDNRDFAFGAVEGFFKAAADHAAG